MLKWFIIFLVMFFGILLYSCVKISAEADKKSENYGETQEDTNETNKEDR